MNQTLAIIKPDAMKKDNMENIKKDIIDNGFSILKEKTLLLTDEQACSFYDIHKEKPFFDELVEFMTSHECHVMILEKENAVEEWRNLMGTTDSQKAETGTIRNKYGTDVSMNATHGSDSNENAIKEINFFFNG
ncbi:MAG TPA: nucleoside-diphosphate kinase [Candidatus Marinimicrobia bacterium]|jgi:nucleoside-diphosphate kinase|nr:nucleoside-diphosphate kinase [Candidatus Neomarinimicrobiota bacterium]|tara:strand:+ start:2708 stop:3109 length:402 start_codon:yes stop_codon:yes gene_type:complete